MMILMRAILGTFDRLLMRSWLKMWEALLPVTCGKSRTANVSSSFLPLECTSIPVGRQRTLLMRILTEVKERKRWEPMRDLRSENDDKDSEDDG